MQKLRTSLEGVTAEVAAAQQAAGDGGTASAGRCKSALSIQWRHCKGNGKGLFRECHSTMALQQACTMHS